MPNMTSVTRAISYSHLVATEVAASLGIHNVSAIQGHPLWQPVHIYLLSNNIMYACR